MIGEAIQNECGNGMAGESITPAQRRALFAAATQRGLSLDDLRALTPGRSVSALSRQHASDLLNRLNAGGAFAHPRTRPRGPRRPKGVYAIATAAQRAKIEALRIDLGWTAIGLDSWLSERHYADGRPMDRVDSGIDASEVIELLKAVLSRTRQVAEEGLAGEAASTADQTTL